MRLVLCCVFALMMTLGGCSKGEEAPKAKPEAEKPDKPEANAEEPEATPSGDGELAERCQEAAHHLSFGLIPEGAAAPSDDEKSAMEVVVKASATACQKEGLSAEQAACIMAVSNAEELMQLGACPAIAAKKPSWLRVP